MFKTVGIYKDLEDPEEFQKYYMNEIMPRMLTLPGVVKMKITSLKNTNPNEQPPELRGIQLIIETYYESPHFIKNNAMTPKGKKLIQLFSHNYRENMGAFIASEFTVTPDMIQRIEEPKERKGILSSGNEKEGISPGHSKRQLMRSSEEYRIARREYKYRGARRRIDRNNRIEDN